MMNEEKSFHRVARDILDLCELQFQLLSIDAQRAKQKLTLAILMAVAAAIIGGSSLTAFMVASGFVVSDLVGWTVGASMMFVVGIFVVVMIMMLAVAYFSINKAADALSETKSELSENIKWIKAVLVSPSASPRNQFRATDFASARRAPESTYVTPR